MPPRQHASPIPVATAFLLVLVMTGLAAVAGERDLDYSQYMHWTGGVALESWILDLDAEGDLIVASEPNAITFYEIDADDTPQRIAELSLPFHCRHLDLHGDCLATAQMTDDPYHDDVIKVYDVADPAAPSLRFEVKIAERVENVLTDGRFVYVLVADEGVRIYDIRDFPATRLLATIETGYVYSDGMHLHGDLLFVEDLNTLFDVSIPSEPVALWQIEENNARGAIITDDLFVQVVSNIGLRFYDLSTPSEPVWLADLDPPFGVEDMVARGETLYLVHDTNQGGVATVDISDPQEPVLRGHVKFEPADRVALTSDRVVVVTWPHHARCRLEVVDATSIDTAPLAGRIHGNYNAFSVHGNLGVLGYYGDAAYLYDLQDPDNPVELAAIQDEGNLYSLLLGDGWLAATDGSPAVRFYDVSTPTAPTFMSSVATPGGVGDLRQRGDLLAGTSTDLGVVLIDIGDILAPVVRSVTPFSGYTYSLEFAETGIYVDNDDQIRRIDVSDPDAPRLAWSLPVDGSVGRILIDDGIMYTAVRGPYDRFHVDRHEIGDPDLFPTLIDQIELPQAYSLEKLDDHLYVSGTCLQVVALGESMSVVGQGPGSGLWMGRATAVGDRLYTPCSGSGIYIHHRQAVAPRPLAVPVASGGHLLAAPNPFNPQTELRFRLAEGGEVDLSLYNARGERVIRLADGWYPAGQHRVRWRGEDGRGRRVASGSYVARLVSGRDVQTVRLVLVK